MGDQMINDKKHNDSKLSHEADPAHVSKSRWSRRAILAAGGSTLLPVNWLHAASQLDLDDPWDRLTGLGLGSRIDYAGFELLTISLGAGAGTSTSS